MKLRNLKKIQSYRSHRKCLRRLYINWTLEKCATKYFFDTKILHNLAKQLSNKIDKDLMDSYATPLCDFSTIRGTQTGRSSSHDTFSQVA